MISLGKFFICWGSAVIFLVTSVNAGGLQLEPVGSLDLEVTASALTDNQRITGTFLGGTVTLGDGQGTIHGCVEDGYVRENGNIEFDLRCHATLDDGAALLIHYTGVIVPSPTFWDQFLGAGASLGNGINYWVSRKKMSTNSEKYSWVTGHVIIGDGKFLKAPSESGPGQVVYDLYKLTQ